MNDLCTDIGYKSINHYGEQLCGDHVDIVEQGDHESLMERKGFYYKLYAAQFE